MPPTANVRSYLCACGRPGYAWGMCNRCYQRHARRGSTEPLTGRGMTDVEYLAHFSARSDDGCLLWTGPLTSSGYGAARSSQKAHRLSYATHVSALARGVGLDHLCHTRAVEAGTCSGGVTCIHRRCIEPSHLEPATQAENWRRGVVGASDRCHRGHLYDGTAPIKGGKYVRRTCSACRALH